MLHGILFGKRSLDGRGAASNHTVTGKQCLEQSNARPPRLFRPCLNPLFGESRPTYVSGLIDPLTPRMGSIRPP